MEVRYHKEWSASPVSYWVHIEKEQAKEFQNNSYSPPLQSAIKGLGFPKFFIEYNGIILQFSSIAEVEHTIEILSEKNLPTTQSLTKKRALLSPKIESFNSVRSAWYRGPNKHWLSRLPSKCKPWSFREGLVKYLKLSLKYFKLEIRCK